MRTYELMYVLNPAIGDDNIKAEMDRIQSIVETQGKIHVANWLTKFRTNKKAIMFLFILSQNRISLKKLNVYSRSQIVSYAI